jgi:hypothetical protein
MNSMDFQKYFEHEIKQFNQSLAKEGSIQQFKSFAYPKLTNELKEGES